MADTDALPDPIAQPKEWVVRTLAILLEGMPEMFAEYQETFGNLDPELTISEAGLVYLAACIFEGFGLIEPLSSPVIIMGFMSKLAHDRLEGKEKPGHRFRTTWDDMESIG